MLKINRETKTLHPLSSKRLCDASILERSDLQEFIANSPSDFFIGINEELKLFMVDKEVGDVTRPREDGRIEIDGHVKSSGSVHIPNASAGRIPAGLCGALGFPHSPAKDQDGS